MTVDNPPAQDERFGRRYRVVFNDGTRKPKQVIVTFLEQVGNEYVFDTRPKAGTLRMRVQDVSMMVETEMPLQPWPQPVGTAGRR